MGKVSKGSYPSHHAHLVGRRLGNEAAAIYYANRSDEGLTLETSAFLPFWWLIYVFNPVVNTKLPAILSHRRSTTVSLETYPFIIIQLLLH